MLQHNLQGIIEKKEVAAMTLQEAIEARHSVRRYLQKEIPAETRAALDAACREYNEKGGLQMQILYDEPICFSSRMAHYGHFENANNYIAVVGKKAEDLEERAGYWGEMLVLTAQTLGLNTCWAALTHGKSKAVVNKGETEVIVISLGYGKTQGKEHISKSAAELSDCSGEAPEWYKNGIEAAMKAPTAVNQQKFRFSRSGDAVSVSIPKFGVCLKTDLGIVKCHFALGAGEENFRWA